MKSAFFCNYLWAIGFKTIFNDKNILLFKQLKLFFIIIYEFQVWK